mgnify:CR=1 FL=1
MTMMKLRQRLCGFFGHTILARERVRIHAGRSVRVVRFECVDCGRVSGWLHPVVGSPDLVELLDMATKNMGVEDEQGCH